jgi:hypothetical protein
MRAQAGFFEKINRNAASNLSRSARSVTIPGTISTATSSATARAFYRLMGMSHR